MAFSNDGKKVAFGTGRWESDDGFVEVRDSYTGKRLAGPLSHNNLVHALRFDLTDKKLITGDHSGRLRVWDVESGEAPLVNVRAGNRITDIDLHPDGRTIAVTVASDSGNTQFRDITDGQPSQKIKPLSNFTGGRTIAFSPDGNRILSVSRQGLGIWEAATGLLGRRTFVHKSHVLQARFSPDGKFVVAGDMAGNAIVWDIQSGVQTGQLLHHSGWVHTVAFSPDGKGLLTGADDGNVRYWKLNKNSQSKELMSLRGSCRAIEFSADARLVAQETEMQVNRVDILEVNTGKHIRSFAGNTFLGIAFYSPRCVAIGFHGEKPSVQFLDVETGEELYKRLPHRLGAIRLVFNADNTRLIVGHGNEDANSDGEVVVWNLEKQEHLYPPILHKKPVSSVAIHPDSQYFGTGSDRGQIRLFQMETGKELGRSDEHRSQSWVTGLCFVQRGRFLVSGNRDGVVRLWKVNEPGWSSSVDSIDLRSPIQGIVVLSDDRTVAIGIASGDVHFWDTVTGEHAGMIRRRQNELRCLNSDSTGRMLALSFFGATELCYSPEPISTNARLLESDIQQANGIALTESGDRLLLNASEWKQLGSTR